jgi:hypothetical protein
MTGAKRKIAFVLAASDQGTLIVNRLDYRMVDATRGYRVGYQILEVRPCVICLTYKASILLIIRIFSYL